MQERPEVVEQSARPNSGASHDGMPRNQVVDFSSWARSAAPCEINAQEAGLFLQLLDPDATSFIFTSGDDDKERTKGQVSRGKPPPFHHRHGRIADHDVLVWMQERQAKGWNVGVTVQAMEGKKRRADQLGYIRAIFAEMDHGLPTSWPLEPSIISETSPDRFHIYFLVDPEAPISEADFHGCMMCMVEVYGSDPSAKDTARTLRLPGSWNLKPGRKPHQVRIIHESGVRYSRDDLVSAFPAPPRSKPTPHVPRPHLSGCAPPGLERFAGDDGPLKVISPDQYDAWIVVGQALHHESNGGADGLALWDQWSAGSSKCTIGVCAQRWRSFGRRKGVTGGTIHALAESTGWRKSARRRGRGANGQRAPAVRTAQPAETLATNWPQSSENGKPRARSQENIGAFLKARGVKLAHNDFTYRNEVEIDGTTRELSDALLRTLRLEADALGLAPPRDYFVDVCHDLAQRNSYHPILDYLSELRWDRRPRVDSWLSTYTGALDTDLNRAFGSKTLLAGVRRVRQPGCKSDAALILEGPQGAGKSSAFRILAGDPWFTDNLSIDADAKLVIEQTAGAWFVEMAELSGIRRGEVEAIKAMISRQSDRARPAYERHALDRRRQFILVGTVNDAEYLRDMTGNRRFWPVRVGKIDLAALRRDRDQLWAEAAHREAQGEGLELSQHLWSVAADEQAERVISDPWEHTLAPRLDGKTGAVAVSDLWLALSIKADRQDTNAARRLTGILLRLGFKSRTRKWRGKAREYCYVNTDNVGDAEWLAI